MPLDLPKSAKVQLRIRAKSGHKLCGTLVQQGSPFRTFERVIYDIENKCFLRGAGATFFGHCA